MLRRALPPLLTMLALVLPGAPRAEAPPPSDPADAAAKPGAAGRRDGAAAGVEVPLPAPPEPAAPAAEVPPDDSWVDGGHAFIEQRLFASVLQLDRFFSDERDVDPERSRSFVRWRSSVRAAEDADQLAVTTGVRATLRLPALSQRFRRLRLVLAGGTREAIDAPLVKAPAGTGPPEPTAEDEGVGPGDAGLRYFLWDSVAARVDLGGGALLHRPLGVYGRLRFRWVVPLKRVFLSRTVVTGFWRSDVKFGTSATLELQRPITRRLVVRLAGAGTLSEESLGVEWASELGLLASLTQRVAAQVAVGINGATDAEAYVMDAGTSLPRAVHAPDFDRIRAYTRFRRDFYRRWLFFEIEPEIAWPWSPERGRYHAFGATLRVEVQFRGTEALSKVEGPRELDGEAPAQPPPRAPDREYGP